MEVILITPTPKYQSLVSPTKTIQSSSIDILPIIETEVFLNHHYTLSIFLLNNNFPYQFHYPLKISKYLLDRNQGPVQLKISNGFHFKIQSDTDTLEILSNLQNSLQGVQRQSQKNVVFFLKWWQITIRLVVINQVKQFGRVKQVMEDIRNKWEDDVNINHTLSHNTNVNLSQNMNHSVNQNINNEISKLILYIDQNNYQQFVSWSDPQTDLFSYQQNQQLSKQYLSLKQQIDNQKILFRNKLKMVQTILGQNINIDKLLSQQKQQNQQYKRLRQTFETIKNIDNVIIQQQKKMQSKRKQLKDKIQQKNRIRYENARKFVKQKNQNIQLRKQLQKMMYKLQCVRKQKTQFQSKRNFQVNDKIKNLLNQQAKKCKQIVRNMTKFNIIKNAEIKQQNMNTNQQLQLQTKSKILQSFHKSNKKQRQQYQKQLKNKVQQFHKEKQSQSNNNNSKQKLFQDMSRYENILKSIAELYENNYQICYQINQKIANLGKYSRDIGMSFNKSMRFNYHKSMSTNMNLSYLSNNLTSNDQNMLFHKIKPNISKSQYSSPSSSISPLPSILSPIFKWPQQQFIVLNQFITQKSQYFNYLTKNKTNKQSQDQQNGNNKISSNVSLGNINNNNSMKYIDDQGRNHRHSGKNRGSFASRSSKIDMEGNKKYNNAAIFGYQNNGVNSNNQEILAKSRNKLFKKAIIKAPILNQKKMGVSKI